MCKVSSQHILGVFCSKIEIQVFNKIYTTSQPIPKSCSTRKIQFFGGKKNYNTYAPLKLHERITCDCDFYYYLILSIT